MVVTKADDTGGLVSTRTVKEQILYEIADPSAYLVPDVTLDVTEVEVEPVGRDRVRVSGARGRPRPPTLKVTISTEGGWLAEGEISYGGPNALARAELAARVLEERLALVGLDGPTRIDVIGTVSTFDSVRGDLREAGSFPADGDYRVRMAGSAPDRRPPSGSPTRSSGCTARVPAVAAASVARSSAGCARCPPWSIGPSSTPVSGSCRRTTMAAESIVVPLHEIAHGRAGDKGNRCNISVIAFIPEAYPYLLEQVTAERVHALFAHRGASAVTRYELPRLGALNLVIDDVLEGGVNGSLNLDGHGKTLSFHLLAMPVDVPGEIVERCRVARIGTGGLTRVCRRPPEESAIDGSRWEEEDHDLARRHWFAR